MCFIIWVVIGILPNFIFSSSTRNFCVGALRGQNTFLRGQKSKKLSKMTDFCNFFLGGRASDGGNTPSCSPLMPGASRAPLTKFEHMFCTLCQNYQDLGQLWKNDISIMGISRIQHPRSVDHGYDLWQIGRGVQGAAFGSLVGSVCDFRQFWTYFDAIWCIKISNYNARFIWFRIVFIKKFCLILMHF